MIRLPDDAEVEWTLEELIRELRRAAPPSYLALVRSALRMALEVERARAVGRRAVIINPNGKELYELKGFQP